MAKLNVSFLQSATSAMFNASEWTPTGESHPLKDILDAQDPNLWGQIDGDGVVTATTFSDGNVGMRITISFKNGGSLELKLSGKSKLTEGDAVKVDTIVGTELKKAGQANIVRYDGEPA